MLRSPSIVIFCILLLIASMAADYVHKNHPHPYKVRYYPKNTVFRKSALLNSGCIVFIRDCPHAYKQNMICARHYDGQFRTFNNYCDMEYLNCNSWRQWAMIKRERC